MKTKLGLIAYCGALLFFGGVFLIADAGNTTNLGRVQHLQTREEQSDAVTLQWKEVKRAASYHVRLLQRNGDSGKFEQIRVITKIQKTTATVEDLEVNTSYRFQVRAVRKKQRGRWSKVVEVTTKPSDTEEDEDENEDDADQENPNDENSNPDDETDCTSNQSPVFTADITDLTKVSDIVPPPSLSGTVLKTHSFLNTQLERVPVYAPTNAELLYGAYYLEGNPGGEYILAFRLSCEMTFIVDHITEPIAAIRDVFPETPKGDTKSDYPTSKVNLMAGDLIAYTTGTIYGIWDFGVYNSEEQNQFFGEDGMAARDTTAVCPYDYYSAEKRAQYYDLFARADNRDYPNATDFCTKETWE